MNFSLYPVTPENLVSRDGSGHPVPRVNLLILHAQVESREGEECTSRRLSPRALDAIISELWYDKSSQNSRWRRIRPSCPASTCSLSTLRLNLGRGRNAPPDDSRRELVEALKTLAGALDTLATLEKSNSLREFSVMLLKFSIMSQCLQETRL